ncbi:mediator of RNA polymerase II transcription subunit 32 [Physcomitrium patens]|uniref:Mediator of RNA polymerase II transcription subunit 29 n=1 Tax=Physcomitrium patens TaxID=3218 RepID=A9SZA7_PHYPA|nr:mediator of RNA polymerase II transcription subunit 32-like [Physcomitrium patens]PNR46678.1 hypothetical protein PHYPA_013798 [Physcomitrium patens]|eukprot:XP_024386714.1 mediator of RNA polymerase II transcription subunit 32-like [Physcomitrella patens]
MDHLVQNLQNAYQALISAASDVLDAKGTADLARTAKTDAALEQFYNNLQLFHAACDQTQEFVEYLQLRIGSECLVDEATGSVTAKVGKPGQDAADNRVAIPSLSALRLEQMSKAVRWLVIELQQGATAGDNSAAMDIRTEDDANQ